MLVGHLPHLARLTGLLLGADPDGAVVAFRPGTLVVLERSDAGWVAAAVVPPQGSFGP
jgi:phosphohistidine phosphatase